MAASVGGYDCELFLSPVLGELKCGPCKQVAREANLTSCCGEHFCKLCIEHVVRDNKPCPSCEETEVSILGTKKRDHRKILALEVRCAMKDRGCDWTGTLEQLDAHLDMNCQYVDVQCPNKCKQPIQKCCLPTHLANECTERDFFCQYCNFTATYEVVCNDHWPQCPFYPIPCPNGCEIMAIERADLSAHLMLCSLEVVECDFSYTGCNVKLVREEMERHLADNLQRHMLMINKTLQEKIEQLEARLEEKDKQIQEVQERNEQQIQELREEKDQQIQEQVREREQLRQDKDRQIQELRKERDQHVQDLQEKEDRQIQELQKTVKEEQEKQVQETRVKVARFEAQLGAIFMTMRCGVLQFIMNRFQEIKGRNGNWNSPPLYTHPGGYKIGIRVYPNGYVGGKGTHVTVWMCHAKGENDDQLKWPANCTITLQLLNQHRDQDHFTMSQRFQWDKPTRTTIMSLDNFNNQKFIAHQDLNWNAEKQTQYLKNDSLQFRVSDIQVYSL